MEYLILRAFFFFPSASLFRQEQYFVWLAAPRLGVHTSNRIYGGTDAHPVCFPESVFPLQSGRPISEVFTFLVLIDGTLFCKVPCWTIPWLNPAHNPGKVLRTLEGVLRRFLGALQIGRGR